MIIIIVINNNNNNKYDYCYCYNDTFIYKQSCYLPIQLLHLCRMNGVYLLLQNISESIRYKQ